MKRTTMLACIFAAAALYGCKSCGDDHPYVPYSIGEGGAQASATEDGALSAIHEDAGFAEQKALIAPADAAEWTLEGLKLKAPGGTAFVLGLARDLDGDGLVDALTVVRPKAGPTGAQILFYKGRSGGTVEPGTVVGEPPPLGADPTCTPTQRLGQIGRHSAFVELGATCAGHALGPSRWAAVVAVGRTAGVHFSLLVIDPPGAPTMTLDADASDFDGDGIDDLALRVTVEGGGPPFEPGPRLSAVVRWIDRPAGMSRDPAEPEASLRKLASQAAARASHSKEVASVPTLVHQVAALYAAICAEGGAPRLTHVGGGDHAIACGSASHALEEADLAEVRARATSGDILDAIAALDRAQAPPATRTQARATEAQGWILAAAPSVVASSLRVIAAIPLVERGHAPAWGALAFEPSGKLLVRSLSQVVRVDPAQGDEAEASDIASWKSTIVSPDGSMRWTEVYDPCDGFALHATFAPTGDAVPRDVALPLAARLAARCNGAKGEPVVALPLAWGPGGLEAIAAQQPVLIAPDMTHASALASPLSDTPHMGAPRSPDGKTLVVPTTLGIVVRGAHTRIYRAKELDGAYSELRDCAVNNDATAVACVRGGRAFVGTWSAP